MADFFPKTGNHAMNSANFGAKVGRLATNRVLSDRLLAINCDSSRSHIVCIVEDLVDSSGLDGDGGFGGDERVEVGLGLGEFFVYAANPLPMRQGACGRGC